MVNLAAAVAPVGEMPVGSMVELPGRGSTYVIDTGTTERDADSPTLVLLHALACTGTLTWYPAIAKLAEKARVVVLDQRWHGRGIRSERFTSRTAPTTSRHWRTCSRWIASSRSGTRWVRWSRS